MSTFGVMVDVMSTLCWFSIPSSFTVPLDCCSFCNDICPIQMCISCFCLRVWIEVDGFQDGIFCCDGDGGNRHILYWFSTTSFQYLLIFVFCHCYKCPIGVSTSYFCSWIWVEVDEFKGGVGCGHGDGSGCILCWFFISKTSFPIAVYHFFQIAATPLMMIMLYLEHGLEVWKCVACGQD